MLQPKTITKTPNAVYRLNPVEFLTVLLCFGQSVPRRISIEETLSRLGFGDALLAHVQELRAIRRKTKKQTAGGDPELRLKQLSKATGMPVSGIIRNFINAGIKKENREARPSQPKESQQ